MERKTKEHQFFVLKDIFSEYELKEYINGIKNITQKNGESEGLGDFGQDGNSWFYTNGNLYNFLEEDNCVKEDIKDEDNLKIQKCLNLGNSEEIKPKCEPEENQLIDQYDEETVLQQIPEEDTKVEDVLNKFKYQNKAVDTIVVLQEKGKVIAGIIDGQSYMRRLSNAPQKKDPDVNKSGINTWTCGKCGIKFQAQIPYEDHDGSAICKDCWNNLIEGMR